MGPAGVRNRERRLLGGAGIDSDERKDGEDGQACHVPRYTVDLSLPPNERYQQLARAFKAELTALPQLFDEIVENLHPQLSLKAVQRAARLLLRRLHSNEQTEELRGIQKVTGLEMYLLICFQTLLDLFMGCTSGGVRVRRSKGDTTMLHFRTLDWGMDVLRKVVVQLDFIERPGGPIVASNVTYAGFVGVLTGVRKGLSISLNFRPNHDASSRLTNFRFYFHHVLVLLGFRPSISSLLRGCLLPTKTTPEVSTLASIEKRMPNAVSTAAYVIFSDGERTITMEKDHRSAIVRSANDLITITNHDEAEELHPEAMSESQRTSHSTLEKTGMHELIEDSKLRKGCAVTMWERFSRGSDSNRAISRPRLFEWIQSYPITNEETHYAVIMDPAEGRLTWIKRYLDPIDP